MSFGPYDLVVVVVLIVGFLHGRAKGFAWQLSGIATLFLGYLAATAGAALLFPLFPDAWPTDVKKFAAWLATYAVVTAAVYLVTLKLSKKIKEHELEELDRRYGGALGAMKAALILGVVSLAAVATSERARTLVKESASGPILARIAYIARPLLPAKIADAVGTVAGKIAPEPVQPAPPPHPVQPGPRPIQPLPGTNRLDSRPSTAPSKPQLDEPILDDDDFMDEPATDPEPVDPLAPPPRR